MRQQHTKGCYERQNAGTMSDSILHECNALCHDVKIYNTLAINTMLADKWVG